MLLRHENYTQSVLAPSAESVSAAAQAVLEATGRHVLCLDGDALSYGKPDSLTVAKFQQP
jgi:3'-phosphoadenosine 5'-phosphosulfate (PAPS) 3'-phosphatase